jgi:hypothetical protein
VDIVRRTAARYVSDARSRGELRVTIIAGQLVRELHLQGRVPSVCSALGSKKFLAENGIALEKRDGPPSGISTTTRFTYRIESASARLLHLTRFILPARLGRESTFTLRTISKSGSW